MIDRIRIKKNGSYIVNVLKMKGEKNYKKDKYGTMIILKSENLKIIASTRVLIIDHSLPKWYFGNNLQVFDFISLNACLDKLSRELNINLDDAEIRVFEIGLNIDMDNLAKHYIHSIAMMKYMYKKLTTSNYCKLYNGSSYFKNYDKIQELKRKKINIPDWYKNTIRLEYGVNKNPHNFLGRTIRIIDLKECNSYAEIIERFYQKFLDLYFSFKVKLIINSGITPKETITYLALLFKNMVDNESFSNILNSCARTSQDKSRVMRSLSDFQKNKNITMRNYLEQELKFKVLRAVLQQIKLVYKGYPDELKKSLNNIFRIHKLLWNT